MSDDSAAGTAKRRTRKDEGIEDAVIIDEAPSAQPVADEAVVVVETVVATADPAEAAEPGHRVVYVQVPAAPKKLGNRGIGSLVAVVSALVFTAILALITAIIGAASTGGFSFAFLGRGEFYIPTLFFVVAFVLLVLIINRANWWAFIVGSVVVGVVVYFGTIGLGLLTNGVVLMTPDQAALSFRDSLGNPFVIVSALLAREVALWTGGIISRRGRRLRVRNAEGRAAYDRELATTRAEHERAATAAPTAV